MRESVMTEPGPGAGARAHHPIVFIIIKFLSSFHDSACFNERKKERDITLSEKKFRYKIFYSLILLN